MSIRAKIQAAFLFLSVTALMASGASLYLLGRGYASLESESEVIDSYSGKVQRAHEIVDSVYQQTFSSLLLGVDDPYTLPELDRDSIEFYGLLDGMDSLLPERRAQHSAFREAYVSYYIFANRLLAQNHSRTKIASREMLENFQLRQHILAGELLQTLSGMREEQREKTALIERVADSMYRLSLAVAAATVIAAALVAWLLSRSFARPMTRLVRWVESTEVGGESRQCEPDSFGSDEVGKLALAFADLRKRLALKDRELMRRNLESVGRLAGGVAHEYNNLLNAISACLYPLRSGKVDEGQVREEAERMALLCRRGGDLSSQLLAVAGKRAGNAEWVDPSFFSSQLETLLPRLVTQGISISVKAENDLPSIRCSPALLLSALLNLVYNAVDSMEDGGRLNLAVFAEEEPDGSRSVVFSVADTGKGIQADALPLIFDPFFTTKEPGRGTGLGLSIVHSFAENHGGAVSVTSGARGTEFRIRLPVAEVDGADRGAERKNAAVLTERMEAGELVAQALFAAGMTPLLPRNGEDLLDALQRFTSRISLVLIDTELTDIAPELAHKLIKRFFPGVPVAFFGPNRSLAASIDPLANWMETPSPENLAKMRQGETGNKTH